MGTVNCYLLHTAAGFVLIDSGGANARKQLLAALDVAGVQPGSLQLILITHGDFDHTGNAAHLHRIYQAPIAMHPADVGMAEHADMFHGRKPNAVLGALIPPLSGFGKDERFTPDVLLAAGDSLAAYGVEAQVLSLPGHSQGSVGVLTTAGDLFCGDLCENLKAPQLGSIMDDVPAAQASLQRLRGMSIGTVYPGHGKAFQFSELLQAGD
jgi:glyoxylase-like metal-dependent hydrolase (beta-lactamase superfamily II)